MVPFITGLFLTCDWSKSPGLILSLSIPHALLFSRRTNHVDDVSKAEVRFDPRVMDGQRLAEGITGLGYPSRHLSTTVVSDGEGGGQGGQGTGDARGEERVSLEVSGVFRPACVAEVRGIARKL